MASADLLERFDDGGLVVGIEYDHVVRSHVRRPSGTGSRLLQASFARQVPHAPVPHITAWMIHGNQDKHSNHIVASCSP
jgi:hypothetical protein